MHHKVALFSAFAALARAQQAGTETAEVHPPLTWEECTAPDSCSAVEGTIVLDSNWRFVHDVNGIENCYEGNTWNETICPDNVACAENCALEGVDYQGTYGITSEGSSLTLSYVTEHQYGTNIGSRVYLMEDESNYRLFDLLNNEFTFDVDLSQLPCGLNGALYFVSMDGDGGSGRFPGNAAGAAYGTGYCDAQCARDLKFINGEANVEGWIPSETDENGGVGNYGACCPEMDVWEANSISTAFTPHSCDAAEQTRCEEPTCGGTYGTDRYAGPCDPDGCDFNSYRMGNTEFYGAGGTVDSSSVMTVVTQFITDTGDASGTLSELRRFYVQNGEVIANSQSAIEGVTGNVINAEFCAAQKSVFGDEDTYEQHGGWPSMSAGMEQGMVLVMSLWDDQYASMEWLDSNYPPEGDPATPGVARGTCENGSGAPDVVRESSPGATVTFSNIKFGPLNSTFAAPA